MASESPSSGGAPGSEGGAALTATGRDLARLPVRLGAIAGLAAVLVALTDLALGISQPSGLGAMVAAIPLLLLVLWVAAVYLSQRTAVGPLGRAGAWASALCLLILAILSVSRSLAPASVVNRLLETTLAGSAASLALCILVWGLLAIGTASLRAGVLPRGSVVLWMAGLSADVLLSSTTAALVGAGGVMWSSLALLRRRAHTDPAGGAAPATRVASPERWLPLDALRGTIMALMAIDHASLFVRRWHPFETWDQPLPDYPSLAALFTRLATHPCAPGFYFLMGAGMSLFLRARRAAGWSDRKIMGHLALRGLLFIFLEQVIVDPVLAGGVRWLEFSILAGLGAVMLLAVPFLRLSGRVQAVSGAVIILSLQVLPGWLEQVELGVLAPIRLLLVPGSVGPAYVLYPPIPWLGIALLGMAFAGLMQSDARRAFRLALVIGLACLALFPLLRALGGFGNLRMPAGDGLMDFFNLVKYPPSLSFLLLSLGFDLVLLALFSRATRWLTSTARPLVVLGQAALYFFLAHWTVYAVLGGTFFPTPGGLPATYLIWIVGLAALLPICWGFEAFKRRMPMDSVWRMI